MNKFILLLIAFVFAGVAVAQETLNERIFWDPPGSYEDGSAIESGDITSYTIACGVESGDYTMTVNVPGVTNEQTRNELMTALGLVMGGTYHCVTRATTANEQTSANSNEVHFSIPDTRVPGPPTLGVE